MDKDKRDLYADLELPGITQDQALIKKQYKKLSLKKHPDRPGGSNEAFSIINHAHDVLTNPEKKRKYDADLARRNRTTYGSGVKGNPWATAGSQWAPPPRPPNFPQRSASSTQKRQPSSTADKFAEMAGSARRPQPKPTDSAHTWSQWQAWDNIRSGSKNKPAAANQPTGSGASARVASASRPPPPPPPVPPRASPQKQPKGSFGARVQRGGYIPESPGDEPSVTKDNYFTTRTHSTLFNETSTAARARRRAPPSPPSNVEDDSAFTETRQSTPYQTQGGERFDPWNGASNIGRSKSTRESNRKSYNSEGESSTPASARQRSASIPNGADSSPQGPHNGDGQRAASATPASGEYEDSTKNGVADSGKNGSYFTTGDEDFYSKKTLDLPPELEELIFQFQSSSEDKSPAHQGLNSFEQNLKKIIQLLSANKYNPQAVALPNAKTTRVAQQSKKGANIANHHSFGTQQADESHRFTRNSTDNINTRFVAEEDANYQFSAGSPVAEDGRPAMPRSKSGGRVGRSPFNAQTPQNPFTQPTNGSAAQNSSFDPAEWSEKIGPQIFEAPAAQKTPAPSGRPMRKSSKKPVRMTAGTAGMVDSDEGSSGQEDSSRSATASARTSGGLDGMASPMPMDVDTPMNETIHSDVRNIPVTPSRPEWRAGDVGLGIKVDGKTATGQQAGFSPPVGGSEDTEEFRASFADLRNVEPFAERPTGLDSFGDLKSNLPFQSAASGQAPVRKPVAARTQNLSLPDPPKPPASPAALGPNLGLKPSTSTWKKYLDDFGQYMVEWHLYNTLFIDHFAARRLQMQSKLSNLDWVSARDGSGLEEYNSWAEQDRTVRDKWAIACNNHDIHMRGFMVNRQKMMK
ncbi:hypothetical protein N0V93_007749 [Gnomoniopsis smithogilvyi]|uniref:J domain-containing protein n=1 Tax=Gnomoniopsis smithogilvyi TaxID=1191159 RepID=A0A9W8YNQ1_9PEZI|nr:hypothetical protein N0V93_007749 [Gnomoniopsis smithogilvyi]